VKRRHPGMPRGFGYMLFRAAVEGGSYANIGFSFRLDSADYRAGDTVLIYDGDRPIIEVVIEEGSLYSLCSLGELNSMLRAKTPASAQRAALHWANTSWVERYVWDRGRLNPVYKFEGAKRLRAYRDERGWQLTTDQTMALVDPTASSPTSTDVWQRQLQAVENACAAFHRIVDSAADDWMRKRLMEAGADLDSAKAKARQLATLGQSLDLAGAQDGDDGTRAEALDQLATLRQSTLRAVQLATQAMLNRPDEVDAEFNDSLQSMADAFSELHDSRSGSTPQLPI
jgi:hypothetical protein